MEKIASYLKISDFVPKDGDEVKLLPEYVTKNKNETFTVSKVDKFKGKCWISDEHGRGWFVTFNQIKKA